MLLFKSCVLKVGHLTKNLKDPKINMKFHSKPKHIYNYSWTTLRDKHCRKPHCHNGVVDTLGQSSVSLCLPKKNRGNTPVILILSKSYFVGAFHCMFENKLMRTRINVICKHQ